MKMDCASPLSFVGTFVGTVVATALSTARVSNDKGGNEGIDKGCRGDVCFRENPARAIPPST